MVDFDAATASEDDFNSHMTAQLSGVEGPEVEDDEPVEAATEEAPAEQEAQGEEQDTGAEPTLDEYLARFDGVDLNSAPKGTAIPMPRFRQVLAARNEARQELEQLRTEVERLKQQAAKPEWMDEFASTIGNGKQAKSDEDAWLDEILGPSPEAQQQLGADQIRELFDQHPTIQRFNSFMEQQETAHRQAQEASRLRDQVQEVMEAYPGVPQQMLLDAYVAGRDMFSTAKMLSEWRGGQNEGPATRRAPAAEAPPTVNRSASRPAPAPKVDAASNLDDDSFLQHMRGAIKVLNR